MSGCCTCSPVGRNKAPEHTSPPGPEVFLLARTPLGTRRHALVSLPPGIHEKKSVLVPGEVTSWDTASAPGITAARSSDWVSDSAYWNYTVDTTPTVSSDVYLANQSDGGAGIPGTFTFTPKVKDIASVNGQVAVATDSELHVLLQLRADCHGQSRSRWC